VVMPGRRAPSSRSSVRRTMRATRRNPLQSEADSIDTSPLWHQPLADGGRHGRRAGRAAKSAAVYDPGGQVTEGAERGRRAGRAADRSLLIS
jgi:hypothetical protein